jgi:ketopantoate reductase
MNDPLLGAPASLVVIGPGRVGSAFLRAAASQGVPTCALTRADLASGAAFDNVPPGSPLLVATRADSLQAVIDATPDALRDDLVFVQNGMILPLLRQNRLEHVTQGLVYFAATSREGPVEPGAPTLFWGRHAEALVHLLESSGIPARVVEDPAGAAWEIAVKLAWNVIFGVLGDQHGETVGETVSRHRDDIDGLCAELAPVFTRSLGVRVDPAALSSRLVAYSRAIATFRAGVRELPWRSGWVRDAARDLGLPTPRHDRLLAALGH